MLLGVGFALVGPGLAVARLIVAITSSATTPLVYLLTARVASRRAALLAASMHALYPTFVAYSHYLVVGVDVRVPVARDGLRGDPGAGLTATRSRLLSAAGVGALAGLCVLTRTAAAPLPRDRAAVGGLDVSGLARARGRGRVCLLASLLVVAPWQALIVRHEGHFLPLTASGGYNLYLGNNPWVPEGHGSSWGHYDSSAQLLGRVNERVSSTGRHPDLVARQLALEEIAAHPLDFAGRSADRVRMLWAGGRLPPAARARGRLPAVPVGVGGRALDPLLAAQLALVGLAAWGFAIRAPALGRRWFFLG